MAETSVAGYNAGGGGEHFYVGSHLSIQTTFGEEFECIVITFCPRSNILAILEGSNPKPERMNIRMLNVDYIKEFKFLGQREDPLVPKECVVDLNSVVAREERAIRKAQAEAEVEAQRVGVGVTAEAQSIFDALCKTLPVQWDLTDILVMREVRVASPYLPENVTGGTPAANERVRKVLEFERKRLQLRAVVQ